MRIIQLAFREASQPYRLACSLDESIEAHSDTPRFGGFLDKDHSPRNTARMLRQGTSDARDASNSA